MEKEVERLAPGFRQRILKRHSAHPGGGLHGGPGGNAARTALRTERLRSLLRR
jgi:hypothetical protein